MSKDQKCCCGCSGEDENLIKAKEAIAAHKESKGALIPILHEIQEIYGYLPEEVLRLISQELNIPMSEIYGVATFYSIFSLEKKGQHIIRVCLGTACYVKGSQTIIDKLSEYLNVEVGKTTSDGKFTLESTRCLGACGLSPAMMIDEKVYGRLVPEDVPRILEEYK